MTTPIEVEPAIIRTERGLTLAGTRLTVYDIMDYLVAGWEREGIRDSFLLTDRQIDVLLAYIHDHRQEVDAEYQEVLRAGEEIRQYWEERNRERLAQIAARPYPPEQEAIRAKLRARKQRLADEQ
jgi:uncharacterized protein (DUF433 family)